MGYRFRWDENKNTENIKKHGVSFMMAARIFSDPCRIEWHDFFHSTQSEDRWIGIGLSCCDLLTVIFTEKDDNIRIISARKADKTEEEEYFDGYSEIHARY